MIDPAWFVMGVAVPGVLAQAFYVTYCWPLKNPRPGRVASAWAIAPGAVFVLGSQAVGGFTPGTGEQRFLLFLLPAVVLVGVLGAMGCVNERVQGLARLAVCMAAPALLLMVNYTGQTPPWSLGAAAAWLGGLAVWMGVCWLGVAGLDQEESGRVNAFVVGLTAAMAGVTIALTGSLKYGQVVGTLAFGVGTLWGVSWLTPRGLASRGFEAVVTPTVLCWLMLAVFFSDLALWQGAVLGASPLLLWLGRLGVVRRYKTRGQIAVAAVALAPSLVVVVMAVMEFMLRANEEPW